MPSKNRAVVVSLALVALLSSCASSPRAGVRIASLQTDLSLGITPPPVIKATPVPGLPPINIPLPKDLTPPPPPPPAFTCPTASIFAQPDKAATPVLEGKPTPGLYAWKYRITVKDPGRAKQYLGPAWAYYAQTTKGKLFFGTRHVFGIVPDLVDAFAGENVGAGPAGSATLPFNRGSFDFSVNATPAYGPGQDTFWRQDEYRVQPASYVPNAPGLGTTDTGSSISLLLTFWETATGTPANPQGVNVWTAANAPLLNLLDFPVVPGNQVHSSTVLQGVNTTLLGIAGGAVPGPANLTPGPQYNVSLLGNVQGHKWVDACGSVVDSWYEKTVMTVTGPNEPPLVMDYDYGIATQYGGLPVYERIAIPSGSRPAVVIESSIGTLNPKPTSD